MRRAVFLFLLVAFACKPDFGVRESIVDRTEILAVRAEPAEAAPGEAVRFDVLVATPDGTAPAPATAWAWCATPKLLTENGAVAAACNGEGVAPVAVTTGHVSAALPADGCFTFGPETSSADLRPRDPDVTGGYYQPIRATSEGAVAFGFARLACNLPKASGDLTAAYKAAYKRNVNPTLLPLAFPAEVTRGATITLRAAWRPEDAETYVVVDAATQTLVTRRESLRVSWHATAGSFEHDRTGRTDTETETFTDDPWTAPESPGTVHLWVVLRDARGGTAYASADVAVR